MTMAEDLGINAVLALGNLEGSFDRTKNSAEELTNVKYDSLGDALTTIGRSFEGITAKIGDALLPILEQATPIIQKVVDKLINWIDANPQLVSALAIAAGAIGGLLSVLGPVVSMIGMASIAFSGLPALIGAVSASMLPVLGVIALVVGAVVALALSIKENWEGIKAATNNLIETCRPYFEQLKESFSNLWDTCKSIYDTVIQPLFQIIGEIIEECINFAAPLLNLLMTTFSIVFNTISTVWNAIGKPVFNFIMSIVQSVWDVVQPIFNNISSLFSNIVSAISSVWNNIGLPIFNSIMAIVRKVADAVTPAFNTFRNVITSAMNAVLSPIQWVIDKLSSLFGWISDVGSKVGNFISTLNPFKNLFGRESNVDVNYNDVSPALSGQYYQPDTIKSRSITGLTNAVGRINTQDNIKANEQAQQIDFNQLKDTIAQSIAEGLKGVILQANVNSYLDGEQLANSLEIAQGRNLNLYGRFNG